MNNKVDINKDSGFFTKNKIIYFSIFFVFTLILLILTIIFILNIDIVSLINNIGSGLQISSYQFIFLVILIGYPMVKVLTSMCYFYLYFRKNNLHFSFYEWMQMTFTIVLIVSITPSSIGSEPYIIYFLNKKIKDLKKTSAVVLASSLIGQVSAMVVTWPSFIWYCTKLTSLENIATNNFTFWFLIVGMIMDIVVLVSFLVLVFTKKTHYFFSLVFHKIKKLFKLKHKSKEEIKKEIIEDGEFKNEVVTQLKDIKIVTLTFLNFVFYNIWYYLMMYFSFALIVGVNDINFWDIFNYTNIGTTANNFVPLPGSEGTLQIILKILLSNSKINETIINDSIFIWRFFTMQLGAMIGILFAIAKGIEFIIVKNKDKNKVLKGV